VRYRMVQALAAAVVLVGAIAAGSGTLTPASGQGPLAGIHVASVVLARGVKQGNMFGEGDLTPIDPGTAFVTTDVPHAFVKVTAAQGQ
jgi:hypothetical protein